MRIALWILTVFLAGLSAPPAFAIEDPLPLCAANGENMRSNSKSTLCWMDNYTTPPGPPSVCSTKKIALPVIRMLGKNPTCDAAKAACNLLPDRSPYRGVVMSNICSPINNGLDYNCTCCVYCASQRWERGD